MSECLPGQIMEIVSLLFSVYMAIADGVLFNSNVSLNPRTDSLENLRQDVISLLAQQNDRIQKLEREVLSIGNHVAFMAELDQSVSATGVGYIGFNNVITNVGQAYHTPQFTVPANGTYYLHFQTVYIPGPSKSSLNVHLVRNDINIQGTLESRSVNGNSTMVILSGSMLLNLSVNDVLRVDITENNGANDIVGGDLNTHFMGFHIN